MAFKELMNEEITTVEIRYSKNLQSAVLVWIGIIVFVGILLPAYIQFSGGGSADIDVFVFFTAMTAALFCLWLVIRFTWYRVDNLGIQFHGILRHSFYLGWNDIESVEMTVTKVSSRGTQPHNEYGLKVKGRGHSFDLSREGLVNGLPQLSVLIQKHVPIDRWAAAAEAIHYYSGQVHSSRIDSRLSKSRGWSEKRKNTVAIILAIIAIAGIIGAIEYANSLPNASGISFVVASVSSVNSTSPPPSGYQHIQLNVQMQDNSPRNLKDNGGETGASPSQFELKTNTGATYRYDPELFNDVPSGISLTKVDSFKIGFEIPIGETAKTLYFYYGVFKISASCG